MRESCKNEYSAKIPSGTMHWVRSRVHAMLKSLKILSRLFSSGSQTKDGGTYKNMKRLRNEDVAEPPIPVLLEKITALKPLCHKGLEGAWWNIILEGIYKIFVEQSSKITIKRPLCFQYPKSSVSQQTTICDAVGELNVCRIWSGQVACATKGRR